MQFLSESSHFPESLHCPHHTGGNVATGTDGAAVRNLDGPSGTAAPVLLCIAVGLLWAVIAATSAAPFGSPSASAAQQSTPGV